MPGTPLRRAAPQRRRPVTVNMCRRAIREQATGSTPKHKKKPMAMAGLLGPLAILVCWGDVAPRPSGSPSFCTTCFEPCTSKGERLRPRSSGNAKARPHPQSAQGRGPGVGTGKTPPVHGRPDPSQRQAGGVVNGLLADHGGVGTSTRWLAVTQNPDVVCCRRRRCGPVPGGLSKAQFAAARAVRRRGAGALTFLKANTP